MEARREGKKITVCWVSLCAAEQCELKVKGGFWGGKYKWEVEQGNGERERVEGKPTKTMCGRTGKPIIAKLTKN